MKTTEWKVESSITLAVVMSHTTAEDVGVDGLTTLAKGRGIKILTDIGARSGYAKEGFMYRICGMEFGGLLILPEAKLNQNEMDYLLTRCRGAGKRGWIFSSDDYHKELIKNNIEEDLDREVQFNGRVTDKFKSRKLEFAKAFGLDGWLLNSGLVDCTEEVE